MPFGGANDKLQCPCMNCFALLPTPTLLGSRPRKKHREHFGLPSVVVIEEEDIDVEEKHIAPIVGLAPVDKELFAKDLVLLVVNHGISWKAAELVVKLVNAHALHRFFVFPLPATTYQLKKITGCRPGNAKLLAVCPVCDFVFDAHQHVCTPCGTPPRLRAQRQLLVNDISITIKQMFGNARLLRPLGMPVIEKQVTETLGMQTLCVTSHWVHLIFQHHMITPSISVVTPRVII